MYEVRSENSSGDIEIYFKSWCGEKWVSVGTNSARDVGISNNDGSSSRPSLAIAPGGTPFLTWAH